MGARSSEWCAGLVIAVGDVGHTEVAGLNNMQELKSR